MTLDTVIMSAGALIAVLPFLGFPRSWDTVFFFLLGILVIILGIIVRRRYTTRESGEPRQYDAFSESMPPGPDRHTENSHDEGQ